MRKWLFSPGMAKIRGGGGEYLELFNWLDIFNSKQLNLYLHNYILWI